MIILEGKYSYQEIADMPMSEIEILLKHNSEFVKMRDKMMEEQRDKIERIEIKERILFQIRYTIYRRCDMVWHNATPIFLLIHFKVTTRTRTNDF